MVDKITFFECLFVCVQVLTKYYLSIYPSVTGADRMICCLLARYGLYSVALIVDRDDHSSFMFHQRLHNTLRDTSTRPHKHQHIKLNQVRVKHTTQHNTNKQNRQQSGEKYSPDCWLTMVYESETRVEVVMCFVMEQTDETKMQHIRQWRGTE